MVNQNVQYGPNGNNDMRNILFILKVFVIAMLLWSIYGCGKPVVCLDNVATDFILLESQVISLSRDALANKGVDVSNMAPVPYHPKQTPNKLFARGGGNSNSGYVLWHKIGESTLFEYSVSLEKQGDKIYCDAGKTL